jgi:hypothetical protein
MSCTRQSAANVAAVALLARLIRLNFTPGKVSLSHSTNSSGYEVLLSL